MTTKPPKSAPYLFTMSSGRQYIVYALSQQAAELFFRTTAECDGRFEVEPYEEKPITVVDDRKAPGA